jgi:hypothetical protein
MKKNLPKQIQRILTTDETIEKSFDLKEGHRVYATNKRLLDLVRRRVQDYDYAHISSIAYTSKRYWWLIALGIVVIIAGVYFGNIFEEIIVWASAGMGCLLIILGMFVKSEWVEVNVVGVNKHVKYKGKRDALDSLLQVVREKRLPEQAVQQKETTDTKKLNFIETIRKLAELRDDGIITQEEFEEKKSKILRNSD